MWYADGVEVQFTGKNTAARFFGERGMSKIRRNHFEADRPGLIRGGPDPMTADKWKGNGHVARPHLQNWLDCIRSRSAPNAPVEVGHRTVTICHLANIARELNRELKWDPSAKTFVDDPVANRLLDRPRRPGFELPSTGV